MSQRIILKKLAKYVNYIKEQRFPLTSHLSTEQKIDREYLEKLGTSLFNAKGQCYGFSVIHAAMDSVNKLAWWEDALFTIMKWNGSFDELEKEVQLIDADPDAIWGIERDRKKRKVKLKFIFERVLQYLIYHQTVDIPKTNPLSDLFFDQSDLLDENEHHFELLDGQEVKCIQKRKCFSGYFNHSQLCKLLDKNKLSDTIGLVSSVDHTIRIGYKNKKWLVYDPNDHGSSQSLHHLFSNKKDAAAKIISILGQSVTIEIATLNPKEDLHFPLITSITKEGVFREQGLHLLAMEAKHDLAIAMNDALTKSKGILLFVNALLEKDNFGRTGIQVLIQYASHLLPILLDALKNKEDAVTIFFEALFTKSSSESLGIHLLTRYAPQYLSMVFSLLAQSETGLFLFLRDLIKEDDQGITTLQLIIQLAPQYLPTILKLASGHPQGATMLTQALCHQNTDGYTGIYFAARYAQNQLPLLLAFIDNVDDGVRLFANTLCLQNQNGNTDLHTILRYDRHDFSETLKLVSKNNSNLECIAKAISIPNHQGWTVLHTAACFCPKYLYDIFSMAKSNHEVFKGLLLALQVKVETAINAKWVGRCALELIQCLPDGYSSLLRDLFKDQKLAGSELVGMDLSHLNLNNANFKKALLMKVDFSGAIFHSANFEGATLTDACFFAKGAFDSVSSFNKHFAFLKNQLMDHPQVKLITQAICDNVCEALTQAISLSNADKIKILDDVIRFAKDTQRDEHSWITRYSMLYRRADPLHNLIVLRNQLHQNVLENDEERNTPNKKIKIT